MSRNLDLDDIRSGVLRPRPTPYAAIHFQGLKALDVPQDSLDSFAPSCRSWSSPTSLGEL